MLRSLQGECKFLLFSRVLYVDRRSKCSIVRSENGHGLDTHVYCSKMSDRFVGLYRVLFGDYGGLLTDCFFGSSGINTAHVERIELQLLWFLYLHI